MLTAVVGTIWPRHRPICRRHSLAVGIVPILAEFLKIIFSKKINLSHGSFFNHYFITEKAISIHRGVRGGKKSCADDP
jgi:hypothetical protein